MDEAAARESEAANRPFLNFGYLVYSWIGRLKLVEFLCSLLAGALVPAAYDHASAFGFMSFVAWTTLINVVIDIVLHLVYIWEKLTFLTDHPEIYSSLCALGTLGFCIASITELALAKHAADPEMAHASASFGFFCTTALAIECYLHYRSFKEKATERQERQEKATTQPADNFSDINHV